MSLLLASVFRPFGVDDEFGRKENKLELFHNQVTREQGLFSIRYNHRSFGLYFIAENLETPTVVLDFPTLKQFRKELKKGYDYVGISFIAPNFVKAKRMCEIVREEAPSTRIILGGHGTRIPDIEKLIDCDHVIRGEGIHQLRRLFGEDVNAPMKHPALPSAEHKRILGFPAGGRAGILIPGVGCPNACRFCCTSHFYDKTYTPFLKTGQEIFDTLERLSAELKTDDFFVMDENFLKHKERALELLELMEKNNRQFNFSIFSSAEAVTDFGIDRMARLGVHYLWLGVESKQSLFEKTKDIDIKALIRDLRSAGVFVLASSILFLEHHTKETIWEDIDFAIDLEPDFTQFMQLGPLPQTKLYLDYKEKGLLREDIPYEEWHGQNQLWFDHPHFTGEESAEYLREAFRKEFEVLGPSIVRVGRTMIQGLGSPYYSEQDEFMRARYQRMRKRCKSYYLALPALKKLVPTRHMKDMIDETLALYRQRLGPQNPTHWISTAFIYTMVSLYKMRLAQGREAHNPKAIRTNFRMEPLIYQEMRIRIRGLLRSRRTWAIVEDNGGDAALSLHFSGKVNRKSVDKLVRRVNERMHTTLSGININVAPRAEFRGTSVEALQEKLSAKCENVRVRISEVKGKIKTLYRRRKAWAFIEDTDEGAELSLHFAGKIKQRTFETLMKRLNKRSEGNLKSVRIDFTPLATFKQENAAAFLDRLSQRCNDIRIQYSERQTKRFSFLAALKEKRVCSVSTY